MWFYTDFMKRRNFISLSSSGIAAISVMPSGLIASTNASLKVRLGGPVFEKYNSPEEWVIALKKLGYRAAYCPVAPGADAALIKAYQTAGAKNDIVIAEVGAWSNPISPDQETAKKAIQKCIDSLALADEIGANCCVNVSGSRNPKHWAGPHKDNLTDATFDLIVETTRKIIDAVNPKHTYFTLECMPWAYPDSVDSYLKLIKAIDRERFGVHLDPMNLITSPQIYYRNGEMIRDCFRRLGPQIRSCHAKDITLREDNYMPQLDEIVAGKGNLDYSVFLTELAKLKDVPLMMEHLNTAEEYAQSAKYIRSVGKMVNVEL
ncbi:MAG: sugar phosphate isomerase/epimerase [Prolixibacteraceae bacterium]|nr:sugar phosphate isomerase/epimerase [Prolixibacteraceae bacterium]